MMLIEILVVWTVGIPAAVLTLAGRRARLRHGAPQAALDLDVRRGPLTNVIQFHGASADQR